MVVLPRSNRQTHSLMSSQPAFADGAASAAVLSAPAIIIIRPLP